MSREVIPGPPGKYDWTAQVQLLRHGGLKREPREDPAQAPSQVEKIRAAARKGEEGMKPRARRANSRKKRAQSQNDRRSGAAV